MSETALALKEEVRLIGFDDMPIKELLEKKQHEIMQILPKDMEFGRYVRSITTYIYKHPKLEECSRSSLFVACVEAAELGLDFNPQKGWAYIVPRKGEAFFQAGYRGYIELMHRSGKVSHVEAHLVYAGDKFKIMQGTDPKIEHIVETNSQKRGNIIGAYCIVWYDDRAYQSEWMTKEDIDSIRGRAATDYVWKSDYGEMARKTVVRRIAKYVPITPELAKLMEYDDRLSGITEEGQTARTANEAIDAAMERMNEVQATYTSNAQDIPQDDMPHEQDDLPLERLIINKNLTEDQAYQIIKQLKGKVVADNMVNLTEQECQQIAKYIDMANDKQESLF